VQTNELWIGDGFGQASPHLNIPANIGHAVVAIPTSVRATTFLPAFSALADSTAMSVSNSNVGGKTFKFVASDGVAPQKRRQVAQACESCRKRKKRCHHTESAPPSSTVSNHIDHSPLTPSPSSTSQAPSANPQADLAGHQFSRSAQVEGEHIETSPTLRTAVGTDNQGPEPINTLEESAEIQVCTYIHSRVLSSHDIGSNIAIFVIS
jgi:hypothetical protein